MTRPATTCLLGTVSCTLALTAAPAFGRDAGASSASRVDVAASFAVGWQDNIALTAEEPDKIDVATTHLDLALGYRLVETRDLEIAASLTPFYEWVSDVEDLSNYGVTAAAELSGAFGPDFAAPWYSARAAYTLIRFDDSDPRDGDWIDIELALGKRFTPRFGIHGGYRYHQRWQEDDDPECVTAGCAPQFNWQTGEVFDLERHGVFLHADLTPAEATNVFAEYTFWNGDVAVTGRPAVPNVAVVDDLALEGFTNDDGTPGVFRVWRADADQHVVEVGIDQRFSERLSTRLSAIYLWTSDIQNEISEEDYENTMVTLSFTVEL
ncbi:MAG TPA: hypothetical protein VF210_08930 [Pseudomonadales bacterium]